MDITSWSQLEEAILAQIPKALQILAEDTKQTLMANVQSKWYSQSESIFYQRTMDVLNSISVSPIQQTGNTFTVEVYFDPEKIESMPAQDINHFPSHMNITNGESSYDSQGYNYWIIDWLENGENSSIHSRTAEPAIEETKQWLLEADNYLHEFANILSESLGVQCIVR